MSITEQLPTHIEGALISAVSNVLGVDEQRIDTAESLSSYGFDSITLTQLANQLNQRFDFVRLDASTFLEYTTLTALQQHLYARYAVEFGSLFTPADQSATATAGSTHTETVQPAEVPSSMRTVTNDAGFGFDNDSSADTLSGSALLDDFEFSELTPDAVLTPDAHTAPTPLSRRTEPDDIAVIGIAGQFPGADTALELWENLYHEKNMLTKVPKTRWDWEAIYGDPDSDANVTDCCYGGFLRDLERFDPLFFGISPLEASQMDPQQKLVLQSTWETVENAGYSIDQLRGEEVGVFLGVQRNENLFNLMNSDQQLGPYTNIGNTHSMLANRVSYFFDWKGNSLAVDTACAASSSALHLAYHALQRGEVRYALVGGVTVVQDAFSHIANRKMGLLTNKPEVRSFDKDSEGYLIGEGVATVLLKPLSEAKKAGDYIYGVIKSCAVNQGGKTLFLTAPDPAAHTKVIRSALAQAGLEAADIDYIEGQGTGTALSDKAELKAYADVFTPVGERVQKPGIGSIKGNIGHVESASGITALIKVCLAMKNGFIPPVLNFEALNRDETIGDPPFEIVSRQRLWQRRTGEDNTLVPRRAGVHNFGYGGLSAHYIVEEMIEEAAGTAPSAQVTDELLLFSSKTKPQLDQHLGNMLDYLLSKKYQYLGIQQLRLADCAHTLQIGRQDMPCRIAIIAASVEELITSLSHYLAGHTDHSPTDRWFSNLSEQQIPTDTHHADREQIAVDLYQQQSWQSIAARWVQGASRSEWLAQLWAGDLIPRGKRIPLPGYCFDSMRFSTTETAVSLPVATIKPTANPVAWLQFSSGFERLEQLARTGLLHCFQSLGVCRVVGELLDAKQLKDKLCIAAQHQRLFEVLLQILVRAGVLQAMGDQYRVIRVSGFSDTDELAQQKQQLVCDFSELETQVSLTWDCLQYLPAILRGELPATQILFPDASMQRVEGFYKGNPVIDYFNDLVSWHLLQAVQGTYQTRQPQEKIRILEIGAGTGGITTGILKSIRPYAKHLHYVYSDISSGFTQFGQRTFGADFPFLTFQVLDIEKDPDAQGFTAHSFDIIVASNVLHATANMQHTMQNTRRLLKSTGQLILNEVTHATDYISLTFGLLQGWWAFEDEGQRLPGGPLLNPAMWTKLLQQQGFRTVTVHGNTGPDRKDSGYNVVVASVEARVIPVEIAPPLHDAGASVAVSVTVTQQPPALPLVVCETTDQSEVLSQLCAIFADVLLLDIAQIRSDEPYVNFGVDSFTSLKIIKAINEKLGVKLRNTELFNFPNMIALSQYIQQLMDHAHQNARQSAVATPAEVMATNTVSDKAQHSGHSASAIAALAAAAPVEHNVTENAAIAVIGMSGRFPGAADVDTFWQNLADGKDSITKTPLDRWQGQQFYGGFVDDIANFDPLFFAISPKEAEWMDPQQRLFIQEAWRTFEYAGYASDALKGSRCGVFVGCQESDYLKSCAQQQPEPNGYQGIGNSAAILSARIAYFLDLKGPSLAVDTACSSSLVAIHLACESIRSGTCDMALAGGVSLLCTAESHRVLTKSGMLSPEGRCKTFDDSANGFVPAEAVGAVLLKPLAQALRDGDHVLGVIQAHGINQDGKTNGITASSAPSQSALQTETYQRYGIDPERISYVEAHGTGTSLGDPIEVDALHDTFRARTSRQQFCAVGSVKTNIGHTLAAAGVVGLIKVLLALQHKQLPASLHFNKENRHFQLDETAFYVNTALQDWDSPTGQLRQAAINSFGFSGTNAHCVVEEAPVVVDQDATAAQPFYFIPLSAQTRKDLQAKVVALADYLAQNPDRDTLHDIAATLLLGRTHFDYRVAWVVADQQALLIALREALQQSEESFCKVTPVQQHSVALQHFAKQLLTDSHRGADQRLVAVSSRDALLSLADLYQQGYALDWQQLYPTEPGATAAFRKVPLPTYPFTGQPYWLGGSGLATVKQVAVSAAEVLSTFNFTPADFPEQSPDLKAFQQAYARLTAHCAVLLSSALQAMGAFVSPGSKHTLAELSALFQSEPKYARLLEAFMQILLDAGHLLCEGGHYVRSDDQAQAWQLPFDQVAAETKQLVVQFPRIEAFANLLSACVQRYPQVLRGKLSATEVMFPGSSFDLVKGIYKENATADLYNQILVNNVVAHVRQALADSDPAVTLNILEIGAGTGGTSALLLRELKRQGIGGRISYLYTDISSGFVQYGRRTYGDEHTFARFEVLDIEQPIPANCDYRQTFDVVVAANVIHATRNLYNTMDHVKALIKPQAYLFLNEATDVQPFATMTYGLLDGWWLFEDDLRLVNSPLLDADKWVSFLQSMGFVVAPPQGLEGEQKGPGQHILMAKYTAAQPLDGIAVDVTEQADSLTTAAKVVVEPVTPVSIEVPEPDNVVNVSPAVSSTGVSTATPVMSRQQVQQEVMAAISHILGLQNDDFLLEKQFSDYGLDSISGIDFLSRINERLNIEVGITALFDYPGVVKLSGFIHDTYQVTLPVTHSADLTAADVSQQPNLTPAPLSTNTVPVDKLTASDDLAIIGMSGRFAGAQNVHEFWDNLAAGTCSIDTPPIGRWPAGSMPEDYQAGFLQGIDQFDPLFFNWSGSEAEQADPQQRIFLEEAYTALEDAGYPPQALGGLKCGVFAGVGMSDYLMNMREQGYTGEAQTFWGNSPAVVPARISYFLNLNGPSIAIDTACSSSLVAIHSARRSILADECEIALAGGVFLCTTPHFHTLAQKAQMLAPDSRCKAFDQQADGFVFGEGSGVVVLKRLDAALRDNDYIHAIVKASGVNQDGKTNGITAPSSRSQAELEAAVYDEAGINPETISYVEAHGTGTKLGDPVEVAALSKAFAQYTTKTQFCHLGSVKPNIGHASLAAGMASVIKVVQSFAHEKIPPLLNFSVANEHIDFANSPFLLNAGLQDWDSPAEQPRRAAISGFGLSGTNAHLVLEESPVHLNVLPKWEEVPVLVCLSAKTVSALHQKINDLKNYLQGRGRQYSLGHIAYSLLICREHFNHRAAWVVRSREQLLTLLQQTDSSITAVDSEAPTEMEWRHWTQQLSAAGLPLAEALEKLTRLGEMYCRGEMIDWQAMYGRDMCYRVPVPCYPFERSRFWFPEQQSTVDAEIATLVAADTSAAPEKTWWQPYWQATELPVASTSYAGPVLVFGASDYDLSFARECPLVLVTAGDVYTVFDPATVADATLVVQLRPGQLADYHQLVELLVQRDLMPWQIVHAWPGQRFDLNALQTQLDRGFYSALSIAQALMQQKACPENIRFLHVFTHTHDRAYALNQAIGSFVRTLNREHPNFVCQCLEIPESAALSTVLMRELPRRVPGETEVRYLQSADKQLTRAVKTWRDCSNMLNAQVAAPVALKANGTYLLSGGSGGLAWVFCHYLKQLAESQSIVVNLLLAGRSPLNALKNQQLGTMQSDWCRVSYVQADLTNAQKINALVRQASADPGGITGVFHFAGSNRDAFLAKKTREESQEVLAAKVQGTLLLEQALQGRSVDFVTFFSSASAVTGNVGQADYAYANGVLDAIAQQNNIAGSRTFSVNWALWEAGGMQLSAQKRQSMTAGMGIVGMSSELGIRAWETVLHADAAQYLFLAGEGAKIRTFIRQELAIAAAVAPVVSQPLPQLTPATPVSPNETLEYSIPTKMPGSVNLQSLYEKANRVGRAEAFRTAVVPTEATPHLQPPASQIPPSVVMAKPETHETIGHFLRTAVAEVSRLPLDMISMQRSLDEFGLDSLMITALNNKLTGRFGALPATLLFEYTDLGALTDYLFEKQEDVPLQPPLSPINIQTQSPVTSAGDIYRRAGAVGQPPAELAITETAPPETVVAEAFLQQAVAQVLHVEPDTVSLKRPLDELALDSLMITALNDKLIERFGDLSATLFFEYPNLAALADYLSRKSPVRREAPISEPGLSDNARFAETHNPEHTGLNQPASVQQPLVDDIAIIGVSGIYPEAENPEIFWENLKAGKDSITAIPAERWSVDDYFDADRNQAMQGKMYCKWGGFVDDIDCFDAAFFNISPREAKLMDSNERLFLQTAWSTFEDAGYTRKKLAKSCDMNVGVFAGISSYAYSLWGPQEWDKGNWCTPCGGLWSIANRVSYVMNLNGPSYPVDTACSSSLSAIHQACISLRNGECAMALAGGASFNVHPQQYIGMCQNQMLSPSGKCHSFGEKGDGFVPGEGVGAVLLKPLAKALADGDTIYAVIKGSSVNHGGRTNGYAVPNPKAQARLIKTALRDADIDPVTISYFEAHGTGTALGDPIEFEGLCQAWADYDTDGSPNRQGWCALGSVKSNIGHLNAAAGISGLTKILLQMKHKTLVPSLHAEVPNPKIQFDGSPFFIQQELSPWRTRADGPARRAAISSFGAGGANAHVILEEAPLMPKANYTAAVNPPADYLIVLSARSHEQLIVYAENMLSFWEKHQHEISLADLAYTLQTGREPMSDRLAFVVSDKAGVGLQLRRFLQHAGTAGTVQIDAMQGAGTGIPLGDIFTGQVDEHKAVPAGNERADMAALIAAGNHRLLAGQWVAGADVSWEHLPGRRAAPGGRCISLPTYPFAKKSYWYPVPDVQSMPVSPAREIFHEETPHPERHTDDTDLLAGYQLAFQDLEQVCANGLLAAFQQMQCLQQPGETYTAAQLKARLKLLPEYDQLFDALILILETGRYIERSNHQIHSTSRVNQPGATHDLAYWVAKYPGLLPNFRLLFSCLDQLPAILQGHVPATDIIFPDSSMAMVEGVYKNNAIADYYNSMVVDEVRAFVHSKLSTLTAGQKLNIIEIGSGTGGTSAAVLAALKPYQAHIHYDYTDISLKFIQHGRRHYGAYPFVGFEILDIERPVKHQGFAQQETDLLIATNVLHATRNVSNTLGNARSLLHSGGRIIINEAVETHAFSTLTFGLLSGWWLAEDGHKRLPGSPLLSVKMWTDALCEAGFTAVRAVAPQVTSGVSQNVLVADSAGVVTGKAVSLPAGNKKAEKMAEPLMAEPAIHTGVPSEPDRLAEQVQSIAPRLCRIVAEVIELNPDEINPDSTYINMGIDSILAIEIINKVNQALDINLRTTALFDHATVNQLSAHIAAQHGETRVADTVVPDSAEDIELLAIFQQLHQGHLEADAAGALLDS